jgi:cytoskeleton protein RodZ
LEPQNEGAERRVTPGEWLSQARSQQGLTQQQAAERLNLDVWVVEALESNRFSTLGPPVYAKGHLRKYSTLLGVPTDEVLARYEQLTDTPTVQDPIPATVATPIRGVRPTQSKWRRMMRALVIVGLLAAIAVALLMFNKRAADPVVDDSAAQMPVPAASTTGSESDAVVASQAPVAPAQVAAVPPAVNASVASEQAVEKSASGVSPAPARADQSDVTVSLEFSDTSWTEVYDASGKRLMFDNGVAGRVRTLTGAAPLKVNIGLASGVKLEVNGKPAVIPRRPGRESARFTVAADGSVGEG